MSDGGTELFATPQDASDRVDALNDRFNALQNQAHGPGLKGRTDVPKKLRDKIQSERAKFRKFARRPLFGLWGAYLPRALRTGDYEMLERWNAQHKRLADLLKQALPAGEVLRKAAKPKKLPRQDIKTPLVGGISLLAAAGLGWLFLSRPRRGDCGD